MPELGWKYGYPGIWAIMIALGGVMLLYFRKLGWLGNRKENGKRKK